MRGLTCGAAMLMEARLVLVLVLMLVLVLVLVTATDADADEAEEEEEGTEILLGASIEGLEIILAARAASSSSFFNILKL